MKNAEKAFDKGFTYLEDEDYQKALAAFNQALAGPGANPRAHLGKAEALCGLDRPEEAVQAYEAYLALAPADEEAWNNYGVALDGMDRATEARRAYEKALAINPRNAEAMTNMAAVISAAGDHEKALAYSLKAMAINPSGEVFYNIACYHCLLGRVEAALCALYQAAFVFDEKWLGAALDDPDLKNVIATKGFQEMRAGKRHPPPAGFGDPKANKQLLAALRDESDVDVYSALKRGAEPTLKDENGRFVRGREGMSVLHAAASYGLTGVIKTMLAAGAEVDPVDDAGTTPLMHAGGHPEAAALLLAHGADARHRDKRGRTPLHLPCEAGSVRLLVGAGTEINAQEETGETPLGQAIWLKKSATVQTLLELGADPNLKCGYRYPLQIAALNGLTDIVQLLLAAKADPQLQDQWGKTALMIARQENQLEAAALLEAGSGSTD